MVLAVLIVLVVVGGLAGVKMLQVKKLVEVGKRFALPPESVSSVVAREEKWQGTLSAIGSIMAVQGVDVTTEVPGLVGQIAFQPGAGVAKGDLPVCLANSSAKDRHPA